MGLMAVWYARVLTKNTDKKSRKEKERRGRKGTGRKSSQSKDKGNKSARLPGIGERVLGLDPNHQDGVNRCASLFL